MAKRGACVHFTNPHLTTLSQALTPKKHVSLLQVVAMMTPQKKMLVQTTVKRAPTDVKTPVQTSLAAAAVGTTQLLLMLLQTVT